ncbi:MAG TPA: M48 family metallopeptidase [Azospirillaceae bacterium]|nr:M48 family metallopeptidase [Azospirillaceae bacterium]
MCDSSHTHLMDRRAFLAVLVGAGGAVLTACVETGETGFGVNLVSPAEVNQLGLESWERILAETPPSGNATYQRAASQVAGRILAASGQDPRAWEVRVFQGGDANAFALPGMKIGVYEGMFRVAENPDQFAAVIGHEIGHVQNNHAAERVNSEVATQLGMQLVSAALQAGNIGYANQIAAALGAGAQYGLILPYSRNQELDADRLGLLNMARAGFDPRGAVNLWQNMRRAGGASPPSFLSTHPGAEDRIAQLQRLMPEALEVYRRAAS